MAVFSAGGCLWIRRSYHSLWLFLGPSLSGRHQNGCALVQLDIFLGTHVVLSFSHFYVNSGKQWNVANSGLHPQKTRRQLWGRHPATHLLNHYEVLPPNLTRQPVLMKHLAKSIRPSSRLIYTAPGDVITVIITLLLRRRV